MPKHNIKTAIYWLRDDLRLHDNETLDRAIMENDLVIPIFCIDPRQFRLLELGFHKTGVKRFNFLIECLADLRKSLQQIGGELLVRTGNPEEIITGLANIYGVDKVYAQAEIASEETTVENTLSVELKKIGCELELVWGKTMYHRDDLPFGPEEIPLTSKAFRINASKKAGVRDLISAPTSISVPQGITWGEFPVPADVGLDPSSELHIDSLLEGGESLALARLEYYTFETNLVEKYKWTRNKSLGFDHSSKFSAWMARGCLSPRLIYHTVKRYEAEVKRNISTWWLVFEVVWRDFFIFSHLRFGDRVFHAGGIKNRNVEWSKDRELFQRWMDGRTGIPFADAHLRELKQTGFMSNRGRVNTASFLTRDYEIDWRWGASWFESQLLDYDVSSNWFNWNTQATEIYYTNPIHQSMKYDKKGEYILSRLPELHSLPHPFYHAPWLAEEDDSVERPAVYPIPVFIQKKWGRSINNIKKEIKV